MNRRKNKIDFFVMLEGLGLIGRCGQFVGWWCVDSLPPPGVTFAVSTLQWKRWILLAHLPMSNQTARSLGHSESSFLALKFGSNLLGAMRFIAGAPASVGFVCEVIK